MTTVQTVRGPVALDALGPTLMHEHVFILQPEMLENYGHVFGDGAGGRPYWDEDERVADAVAKLRRLHAGGISTLVDPTVPGLGRGIRRIQRIAAEVELNIVVATGVYAFLELPNFLATRDDDVIAALFVRELREGIDDTGVRAAFLKCAVEHHGVIGDVPRILAAIATAAIQTGAPVMVHTNAQARSGRPALAALLEHGVDPRRVVIAHAGDSNDLDYLKGLADQGASLGFDRFSIEHFNPDADRVRTLARLVADGYADRVHLGHDGACFYDFMVANPTFADERPDPLHLTTTIFPALREAGVTQAQLDQMLIENPRRFFS
jgi:phosphotriesterase-related protein